MKKHIKPNKNRRNREQIYKRQKKGLGVKIFATNQTNKKQTYGKRKKKKFTKNKK